LPPLRSRAPRGGGQAAKLTASQVEIGFDILKACDVPEGAAAGAGPVAVETGARDENTPAATASPAASAGGAGAGGEEAKVADDIRKCYRLMVKRRLLKRHGEELSADSATRKRQLEELYRDAEAGLLSLGAKLRKERGRAGCGRAATGA